MNSLPSAPLSTRSSERQPSPRRVSRDFSAKPRASRRKSQASTPPVCISDPAWPGGGLKQPMEPQTTSDHILDW